MSWVMHGPEKLMCPGAASTQVDALSDWMLQSNLTIPDYPVLAYDLIPLDGDVTQWKAKGRTHFSEKKSNTKQARAAATRYPTASMKHWISYSGCIKCNSGLHLNSNYQVWIPINGQRGHFTIRRTKEIADFLRVCDILFVGLLKPEVRHVNTTYCPPEVLQILRDKGRSMDDIQDELTGKFSILA